MRTNKAKEQLFEHGVKKLKLLGFINVNKHNILTDEVYSLYFLKILQCMQLDKKSRNATADELIEGLVKKNNMKMTSQK